MIRPLRFQIYSPGDVPMKTRAWAVCLACVSLGFILFSLSQPQLTGQEKGREQALVKWEYRSVAASDEQYNQLGSEGWELVAFQSRGNAGTYAHFKRPKR
jgi:hypothetical protein